VEAQVVLVDHVFVGVGRVVDVLVGACAGSNPPGAGAMTESSLRTSGDTGAW